MAKLMLGELLVGAGLVTEEEVLSALRGLRQALRQGADPYVGAAVVPGVALLLAMLASVPSLAWPSFRSSPAVSGSTGV